MGKEKKQTVFVHGGPRAGFDVNYDGIYDFEELFGDLVSWLMSKNYDVSVGEHSEKVASDGKEMKIKIKAFRKITEYVMFHINLEIRFFREVDVMVNYKGKQVKQQKGEAKARIQTKMQKNWNFTFKHNQEFLRQAYEKYIMKKTLSSYEDRLRDEGDTFINLIKKHFAQCRW